MHQEMLTRAIQLHQSMDLDAAEIIYRQILTEDPGHAESAYLLGMMSAQRGQYEEAADFFAKVVELRPEDVGAHNDLGVALQTSGRFTEALDAYHRALDLTPDHPEVLSNLGGALERLGRTRRLSTPTPRSCG